MCDFRALAARVNSCPFKKEGFFIGLGRALLGWTAEAAVPALAGRKLLSVG
jgi:hypothetical protein